VNSFGSTQWQEHGFAAAVLCRIGDAEGFASQAALWLRHACLVLRAAEASEFGLAETSAVVLGRIAGLLEETKES